MAGAKEPFLELVVLGAGPAYTNVPGSLGSAALVRTSEDAAVLDLGQGCFPSLAARHDPTRLSGVLISHLHPDHYIDLIPLRHYLRRPGAEADALLDVLAPEGLAERLDATYAEPGFSAAAFEHRPLAAGRLELGPFGIEIRPVRHVGASFAFRVDVEGEAGPGIVYTGDVSVIEDVRPLIREGDLLFAESTFGPGPVPAGMPHLDAAMVGRLAHEAGASQLVITHVRMGTDLDATLAAARRSFAGPTSLATPGARYLVASAPSPATPWAPSADG